MRAALFGGDKIEGTTIPRITIEMCVRVRGDGVSVEDAPLVPPRCSVGVVAASARANLDHLLPTAILLLVRAASDRCSKIFGAGLCIPWETNQTLLVPSSADSILSKRSGGCMSGVATRPKDCITHSYIRDQENMIGDIAYSGR